MKTLEDLFFGRNIPFDSPALDPDEYQRLTAEIQTNICNCNHFLSNLPHTHKSI